MSRYWVLVCLLLVFSAACSPTTEQIAESGSSVTGEVQEHDEHEHEEEDERIAAGDGDEAASFRDHASHEHGAAQLTIAWSGSELAIDLQTPAYNVLGFEHTPTSAAEQAQFAETMAALQAGDLLQFAPDAGCTLLTAAVHTNLSEEEAPGEETHDDDEETHSDIEVAYNVQCQRPDNLNTLDAGALFARFPNFASLRAQWISDSSQSAKELTPDDPILSFDDD